MYNVNKKPIDFAKFLFKKNPQLQFKKEFLKNGRFLSNLLRCLLNYLIAEGQKSFGEFVIGQT